MGDHSWRQINHIWNEEEIKLQRKSVNLKHVPKTFSDYTNNYFMKTLYHSFNFITGYREENPTPKSLDEH